MDSRPLVTALAAFAVVVAAGLAILAVQPATMPDTTGTPVGTVLLAAQQGGIALQRDETADTRLDARCLRRLARDAGWMDLCWSVTRVADIDPTADYYRLRVYGSVSGYAWPGSLRWAVVGVTRHPGSAPMSVIDSSALAPVGCDPGAEVAASPGCGDGAADPNPDLPWTGHLSSDAGAYAITWTATNALAGVSGTRAIDMAVVEKVDERGLPGWDITADLGG